MRPAGFSSGQQMDRRRLLGLGLFAGAGLGTAIGEVAAFGPSSRLARSILSLIAPTEVEPYRRTIVSMGTFISIAVHDRHGDRYAGAVEEAFNEVRTVDVLMSTFRPESQISRVNRAAGRESVPVDPRVSEVLRAARRMGERSGGVFDVTVLPLLRAFGFREGTPGEEPRRPSPEELRYALAQVDYRTIDIDAAGNAVGLEQVGAEVDLGGIAKGFAVDRAAEVLHARGVRQAVINAGGDLRAIGAPDEADGWRVGIQDPLQPGRILATLELCDQAIATSGNYEHFVEFGEDRLGHLIDPLSGNPLEPMLSATVVAPTAMQADATSTTAFLMGRAPGARLVQQTEGTDYVFLSSTDETAVQVSSGITGLAMSAEK